MKDTSKKIIEKLQNDYILSTLVQNWQPVEGIAACKQITVNAGCFKCEFEPYDQRLDSMDALYAVYIYVPLHELKLNSELPKLIAQNVRQALTEDPSINGAVSTSFVKEIQYTTFTQRDQAAGATVLLEVQEFVERYRDRKIPVVEIIKTDIDYRR